MTQTNSLVVNSDKYWYLKHINTNLTKKHKHFASLCTGESGSGKSYATGGLAHKLYTNINPEQSFSFSPIEFLEKAGEFHPYLFPLILDDAGLSAFSGDALKSHVKNISKICQSIRYKGWQIYINLPHLAMLAKSVRLNYQYLIQTLSIDYENRENIIKFQRLKWTSKGEPMPKYPTQVVTQENPVTGYLEIFPKQYLDVSVEAPPKEIMDNYEVMKEAFMSKFYRETAEEMKSNISDSKESSKTRAFDIASELRDKLDEYTNDKGRMWVEKIMMDYKVNNSVARLAFKMAEVPRDKSSAKKAKKENKSLSKEIDEQLKDFNKIKV